jgi:hypothetical protein
MTVIPEICLVVASEWQLSRLASAKFALVDTTFDKVNHPLDSANRLFLTTIMVPGGAQEPFVPVLYAIHTAENQEIYSHILTEAKRLTRGQDLDVTGTADAPSHRPAYLVSPP